MNFECNSQLISLASGFRLQYEPMQNAYVLLYPEGLVEMNDEAASILSLCERPIAFTHLVAKIEESFEGQSLSEDVKEFLAGAYEQGWIKLTAK
jgi:pyrroloquinoline quinone biosynthesis protein D